MRAIHQYRLLAHLFYDRVGVLFYCKEGEKIMERKLTQLTVRKRGNRMRPMRYARPIVWQQKEDTKRNNAIVMS